MFFFEWGRTSEHQSAGRECGRVSTERRKADGRNCTESLLAASADRSPPRTCNTEKKYFNASMWAGFHNVPKGRSCSLLASFYTPELADAVSDFARGDLEAFGYPRWTPSAETPLPGVGTSEWGPGETVPFARCRCTVI